MNKNYNIQRHKNYVIQRKDGNEYKKNQLTSSQFSLNYENY